MSRNRIAAILSALAVLAAARAVADLDGSYVLPQDDWAIQYATRPLADPVTMLQQKIRRGEAKLKYDPDYGYLPSVLSNLQAPVSSQVLVFSKTSFQAARISPRVPRALYFNDRVSVGWVKGGDVVEIASMDPRQGVIFYTVDQEESSSPKIVRRDECLQCHASGATLGVPGMVVRSVYPDVSGMPLFHVGTFITDHRMQNLITRVGWETRMALESQKAMNQALKRPADEVSDSTTRRINSAADALVAYMLFTDEAPLDGRIAGASGFAEEFVRQGPRDRQGRSLRQFDLTRRIFRYPCSYLIYSEAFDRLPDAARDRIYRSLWDVLADRDHGRAFASLSSSDRQAILEILLDTKPGLPGYWKRSSSFGGVASEAASRPRSEQE